MKQSLTMIIFICTTIATAHAAKPLVTEQWKTPNGTPVIFYQSSEVPMLDISLAFKAGSAYDGNAYGLSALTTRLINQGNNHTNCDLLAEQLAETGAQFDAVTNRDMSVLSLRTLSEPDALTKASQLFASIVAHPDFPLTAFKREKNQQLMAITAAQDIPNTLAEQTFFQALYGNHPYAHPILGTRESVQAISPEQIKQFYQRYFVSNNAVLVLVGAIDKNKATQLAELITQDLATGHEAPSIPQAQPLSKELAIEVVFPSKQTVVYLGQLGVNHHDDDYFPLLVGNYILGGGNLVSQLAHELREQRGLTYGVYSQFLPMPGIGPFVISFATKNSQVAQATAIARTTLDAFINKGPTAQALQEAQQFLTGSFPLALASNRNLTDTLLKCAFYHLPNDYLDTYLKRIQQVTAQQIKHAFQTHIHPNQLVQVTVGPV